MEHWEYLKPDGLRFVWDDTLFRPGTDSFLLSSLPKLSAGLRVCDLGCGHNHWDGGTAYDQIQDRRSYTYHPRKMYLRK